MIGKTLIAVGVVAMLGTGVAGAAYVTKKDDQKSIENKQITERNNNEKEGVYVNFDGKSFEARDNEGKNLKINADGSTRFEDGTGAFAEYGSNGSMEWSDNEGNEFELTPDGSMKTKDEDGSWSKINSDGSFEFSHEDGYIKFNKDGTFEFDIKE